MLESCRDRQSTVTFAQTYRDVANCHRRARILRDEITQEIRTARAMLHDAAQLLAKVT
jgi:hypothetical protein